MYTHLLITAETAKGLHVLTQISDTSKGFWEFYETYSQVFVPSLGCLLGLERGSVFSLRYNDYLPEVPAALVERGIEIVGAELVRFNSAPTKARAGFYRWPQRDATATVEHVFPTQQDHHIKPVPLYAQNIHIRAKTLPDAIEFNSKLSQGHLNRFLADPWE